MSKLNRPAEFGDNLISWILFLGIMVAMIIESCGIQKEHDNIHKHMVSERKALQHEITTLRAELKAHDEKPYWFERKD